jgi:ribosome modulation factor
MDMIAYNAGFKACKDGVNINNHYPYTKGNGYWDWLDGYRDALKLNKTK